MQSQHLSKQILICNKMKILGLLCVLLISNNAYSQYYEQWFHDALKVENPNELAYWPYAGDACPFTRDELGEVVEGVLIRSRIKPLSAGWKTAPVYLKLSVACVKVSNNNPPYSITLYFGRYPGILFDGYYGTVGIGGREFILSVVKEHVELAVDAFIKVNFDLQSLLICKCSDLI